MSCKLNIEVAIKAESLVKKNSLSAHVKDELLKRKVLRIGSKLTSFETEALKENVEAIFICEKEQNDSEDSKASTVCVYHCIRRFWVVDRVVFTICQAFAHLRIPFHFSPEEAHSKISESLADCEHHTVHHPESSDTMCGLLEFMINISTRLTPSKSSIEEDFAVIADTVTLIIHIYRLNKEGSASESLECDESETNAATLCLLPSQLYDGLWESLIYDSDIKKNLLQYARAMLHLSKFGVNQHLVSCNRVVLLHGPPGTGKTSLCKALAQRLSIRLSSTYPQALLVEINTHGLFSKFFSESGKLVSRLFSKLAEMASDPQTMLFILVDEVESLAHSRASFAGNEPSDAIRVVNALLTHLDMMKEFPNVMIFTTSNITGAIDIAFVDRADLRAFIPQPSPTAIYSIYHSCLQELIRAGLIIGTCPNKAVNWNQVNGCVGEEMKNNVILNGNDESLLMQLSKESEGLTGRSLRKVPLRVFSTQINPCPENVARVHEFIVAMMAVVKQMKTEQKEINGDIMLQ